MSNIKLRPLRDITEDMLEERLWQLGQKIEADILLSDEEFEEYEWLSARPHDEGLRKQIAARKWVEDWDTNIEGKDDDEMREIEEQFRRAAL